MAKASKPERYNGSRFYVARVIEHGVSISDGPADYRVYDRDRKGRVSGVPIAVFAKRSDARGWCDGKNDVHDSITRYGR